MKHSCEKGLLTRPERFVLTVRGPPGFSPRYFRAKRHGLMFLLCVCMLKAHPTPPNDIDPQCTGGLAAVLGRLPRGVAPHSGSQEGPGCLKGLQLGSGGHCRPALATRRADTAAMRWR